MFWLVEVNVKNMTISLFLNLQQIFFLLIYMSRLIIYKNRLQYITLILVNQKKWTILPKHILIGMGNLLLIHLIYCYNPS